VGNTNELLVTKGLTKKFGDFVAVNEVNLAIKEQEITSIIGPNGAGKTTFINLISGYTSVSSGKIIFKGEDITKLPAYKRVAKGISRSFQIVNIFPRLTTYQNIQLAILSRLGRSWNIIKSRDAYRDVEDEVRKILEESGLWEKRNVLAGELSHGEQKLLDVAIAISTNPVLCLLDEPAAGLNPLEKDRVLEFIIETFKRRKITYVIIEHDMDVVFRVSDRIIVMHQGKVIADGKPHEIKTSKEVEDIYLGGEEL